MDSSQYSLRRIPQIVNGISSQIAIIAGEGPFTVAQDNLGKVWAWGHDGFGQLGDGNYGQGETRETPQKVTTQGGTELGSVDSLGAGHFHAVAESGGTLYSWGSNLDWRLGQGDLVNNLTLRARAYETVQPQ